MLVWVSKWDKTEWFIGLPLRLRHHVTSAAHSCWTHINTQVENGWVEGWIVLFFYLYVSNWWPQVLILCCLMCRNAGITKRCLDFFFFIWTKQFWPQPNLISLSVTFPKVDHSLQTGLKQNTRKCNSILNHFPPHESFMPGHLSRLLWQISTYESGRRRWSQHKIHVSFKLLLVHSHCEQSGQFHCT